MQLCYSTMPTPQAWPSMRLRGLVVSSAPKSGQETRIDDTIDEFLRSFRGLEQLVLMGSHQEALRPDFSSVAHHAETLQLLYLDIVWSESPTTQASFEMDDCCYNAVSLQSVLKHCTSLRQMALNNLRISLSYDDTDVMRDFGHLFAGQLLDGQVQTP